MPHRTYLSIDQIKTISCAVEEQETSVSYLRQSNTMRIYTSDNTSLTELKKKLRDNPKEWKCWEADKDSFGNPTGYFFEAPKSFITYRTKQKEFIISDEQRQARAERLKIARLKKSNP